VRDRLEASVSADRLEEGYRVAVRIAQLNREAKAARMATELVENFKFLLCSICVVLLGASFIVEDRSLAMWFFRFVAWSVASLSVIDLLDVTTFRPLDLLHRRLMKLIGALQNWIA
jgi:hypothetical protein